MIRPIVLGLVVPMVLVGAGGCLPEAPPIVSADLTPDASARAADEKPGLGETVTLSARLPDGVDGEDVRFRWFQTYGRVVEMIGADSAEASFVVPSVPEKQTRLSFRVDVIAPDGTIYPSETIHVDVAYDPDYSPGDQTDDDDTADQSDDPIDLMKAETDKPASQRAREFDETVENEEDANGNSLFTTASGLQYLIIQTGDGDRPSATDSVHANYAGWLFDDGTEFDSNLSRTSPFTASLQGGVIDGWIEGLQLMTEGSYYRFIIPSDLAYGASGKGSIPPDATLVFDVYLVDIVR